ncbi:MAG: NAD-dependent epimerase/dehydratase family protein [Gemmatimonadota bacterium]|nr:NAD-dependent epimerase/dehydratase family protein [Gemmatimonadota bacterium]
MRPAPGPATAPRPEPELPEEGTTHRVLLSGATGFLGGHLLPRLVARGHRVRALARPGGRPPGADGPTVEWRVADLVDRASLAGLAEGCTAAVHLAIRTRAGRPGDLERAHGAATRHLLAEAARAGVRRFVYVGALGASPAGGPFLRSKFAAEDAVMTSGREFVVLRPCIIYGPGDRFTSAIVRLLRTLPAFPVPGDGTAALQPLAVEDAADALVQAVERADLAGRGFDLAGPERLSLVRIVRIIGRTIGRPRPVVPLPAASAPLVSGLGRVLRLPEPFAPREREILASGSVLPGTENALRDVFRLKPLPFADAVADYLAEAG